MRWRHPFAVLIPAGFASVLWASAGVAGARDARDWLGHQGYAEPTSIQIIACHGYGCAMRADIAIEGPWMRCSPGGGRVAVSGHPTPGSAHFCERNRMADLHASDRGPAPKTSGEPATP